jgi:hypothetical protein
MAIMEMLKAVRLKKFENCTDGFKNFIDLGFLRWYLLECDTVKSGRSLQMFRGKECLHLQSARKIQASSKHSKPRIENVVRPVIETALDQSTFATRDSMLVAFLLIVCLNLGR